MLGFAFASSNSDAIVGTADRKTRAQWQWDGVASRTGTFAHQLASCVANGGKKGGPLSAAAKVQITLRWRHVQNVKSPLWRVCRTSRSKTTTARKDGVPPPPRWNILNVVCALCNHKEIIFSLLCSPHFLLSCSYTSGARRDIIHT